jgi:hypothetical protein
MRIIALFLLLFPTLLMGQQGNYLLTLPERFIIDTYASQNEGFFHTSFKPITKSTLSGYTEIDKLLFRTGSDSAFIAKKKHPWFWKKLLTESLVDTKKDKFSLRVDPLFNFEYGKDTLGRMTVNSRGVVIYGDLSEKFSFTTGVMETQSFPEKYVSDYIKSRSVAPGQGRVKNFKDTGYDYSCSFGNISYSPSSHFNFQLGHGKQFLGDGYRSLLLSDVPFYYPYLRSTTTFKRFQYVNLWTAFQEVKPYDTRTLVYQRKHGSFTYLSYLLSKKIEIGLFEAIIFQSTDSNSNNILPLDIANPIIGVRTLQYGFRNKHNALIGLTAKANIIKLFTIYGQLVIDDLKRKGESGSFHNRYGYQVGLKILEPFKIKNLYFLTEFNSIKPYTYSPSSGYQSYTAFNEPLAHQLGADVDEIITLFRYSYKDAFLQIKLTLATLKGNTDILISGNNVYQFIDSPYSSSSSGYLYNDHVSNLNIEGGIFINQKSKLQLVAGMHFRAYTSITNTSFIYVALKTSISNLYYDF